MLAAANTHTDSTSTWILLGLGAVIGSVLWFVRVKTRKAREARQPEDVDVRLDK